MPVLAHDTHDFHVVRRAIFWRVGVTNVLTDWIFVGEKFFRRFLVDDRNSTALLVFAFVLGEISAAQQFYAQRLAVTGRYRGEERIDARVRRFRVVRHGVFRAQNAARAGEVGIR